MYYNPANLATSQGKTKVGIDYKSQWNSVSKPYLSQLAYFENKIIPKSFKQDWAGIGLILNNDKAGDINLHTIKALLVGSYHKGIIEDNKLFASFGASFGVVSKSFDASKLIFDNQWTQSGFDNSLANDEVLFNTSYLYTDFNAGTMLTYSPTNEISASLGGSLQNLNRPKETTFFESKNKIGVKKVLHGGVDFKIDEKLFFLPKFILVSQKKAKELIMGLNICYSMKETQLYFGVWDRAKSDIILMAGFEYDRLTMAFSYDVNYSKLNVATNYRGGFEISLTKKFGKKNERKVSAGKKTMPML
ncbi:MAG: hypothetical protein A2046_13630 [Bacteroidetes bacterium GWA2_30_7]|nr:MAG: hypothetical protein A2046_13630 [Bacteroidetes bacterium GWA2_30_7]